MTNFMAPMWTIFSPESSLIFKISTSFSETIFSTTLAYLNFYQIVSSMLEIQLYHSSLEFEYLYLSSTSSMFTYLYFYSLWVICPFIWLQSNCNQKPALSVCISSSDLLKPKFVSPIFLTDAFLSILLLFFFSQGSSKDSKRVKSNIY